MVDPHQPSQYRYWDGTEWTDHVAPRLAPPAPTPADRRTSHLARAAIWAALLWTILVFAQLPFVPGTRNAFILEIVTPSAMEI